MIKQIYSGVIFIIIFASIATFIATLEPVRALGLSPLVIGIVMGIIYANTISSKMPNSLDAGVTFSAKKILRFAIVLYGFRITFSEVLGVGLDGFLVSVVMLSSTLILGAWAGQKLFGLDRDTAILTGSGGAICGAAAVLATEPVLKAKDESVAIAVSMVVLFGTISMFLYPALYEGFIKDATGFLHMSPREFGLYVGGTIHEVAQVVAVPASIPNAPESMAHTAVIVKMTRVILIAPTLIILGLILSAKSANDAKSKTKLVIPWFAVYFIFVALFNSMNIVPKDIADKINIADTFLLTMAMTALGVGTNFKKFKGFGLAPLYTALLMFGWLVIGGFIVVKIVVKI